MKSLLPWPSSYLESAAWKGVRQLLDRCHRLSRSRSLPGTLMLTGEAGLGREALAVELSAALICREGRGPLCDCAGCSRVRRGTHPDLQLLDILPDSTEIKIDQARDLVETMSQLPYEGRQRVIIVVSAHTPPLNAFAASALLKALEEPPSHLTWLLLAGNPARALPTIVSRSVLLRVPPPGRQELVALLASTHGIARSAAEDHLRLCLDDVTLAFHTAPGDEARAVVTVGERLRELLAGEPLSALQLGAQAKRAPAAIPLMAQALLAAAGEPAQREPEKVLDAAAQLLAAERRRAVLHLDGESVTVGTLAALPPRRAHRGDSTP